MYDSLSYFVSFSCIDMLASRLWWRRIPNVLSNQKVEQTLWIVGPKADQYLLSIHGIAKLS